MHKRILYSIIMQRDDILYCSCALMHAYCNDE